MGGWHIAIENVAGIRSGEATLQPGVTTVKAENWRGKTSFIAAIETAMGTARQLTEGAERGRVRLETEDDTYEVDLVRRDDTITLEGEPVLDEESDRVCASLYAFLDGRNEVREVVRRGGNLEAVLTRPLDFENLDERIAAHRREREAVADELERARAAADRLPSAQETVTSLEQDLEALRERRSELGPAPADEGESDREALSDARAERDRTASRIERLEATLDRAEERLADRREALAELAGPEANDDLAEELDGERAALADLERDVELLQSVYTAADRLLEEERLGLLAEVDHGVLEDQVTCPLCGHAADRSEFVDHLGGIGERVADLRDEARTHRDRIAELEDRRAAVEEVRRRRAELEDEVASLEATVSERRESLEGARERLSGLEERVEALASTVESQDSELTDVESELKYVEAELEDAREDVERLEARAVRREELERDHDELADEIDRLRGRKDRMKARVRKAFDEAMAELLSRFDTGFETARLTGQFDLVVARDGREASLDALSEGELELIGLVATLAGHRAFEVGDVVSLLLLDDLGDLSDESLHTVVEMVDEHVERVVLTAYPEHSTFDGDVVDPSSWTVVSDGPTAGA